MALPNVSPEELKELCPTISEVEATSKGGQKLVFKCKIGKEYFAIKLQLIEETAPAASSAAEEAEPEQSEESEPIPEALARARREVDVLRKCNIPQIAKIGPIDLSVKAMGHQSVVVFSEEWIAGEDLRTILRSGRRLTYRDAILMATDLAVAIEEIEKLSIVHRDIKPENIMRRSSDGTWVLLDLGFAFDRSGSSLSQANAIPGTMVYLSPERFDMSQKRVMDSRTDLFAVGVVIYEAITGIHPFVKTGMGTLQVISSIRSGKPTPLKQIKEDCPEGVCAIVERLMRKRPHGRYKDAAAFQAALKELLPKLQEEA